MHAIQFFILFIFHSFDTCLGFICCQVFPERSAVLLKFKQTTSETGALIIHWLMFSLVV